MEDYESRIKELEGIRGTLASSANASKGKISELASEAIGMLRAKSAACKSGEAPQKQRGGGNRPRENVRAIFKIENDEKTKTYCDTVLSLLLIDMRRQMGEFDVDEFLKKVGATVGDLEGKPCPSVLHVLKLLTDRGLEQESSRRGYNFSPEESIEYGEEALAGLEQRYNENFSEEEKAAFEGLAPITYYRRTPAEFQGLLGNQPYFLNGRPGNSDEDEEIHGVKTGFDIDTMPLYMNKEERHTMTRGGLPMGAIIIMYGVSIRGSN